MSCWFSTPRPGKTRCQIEIFKEVAGVTGLVMTKLDGSARGGVLVAAAKQFGLPIHAIGVGETIDDLRPFDARDLAVAIAGSRMNDTPTQSQSMACSTSCSISGRCCCFSWRRVSAHPTPIPSKAQLSAPAPSWSPS
jgi:hypothetical protein